MLSENFRIIISATVCESAGKSNSSSNSQNLPQSPHCLTSMCVLDFNKEHNLLPRVLLRLRVLSFLRFNIDVCIKFCLKASKSATKTLENLHTAFRDEALNRTMVFQWHSRSSFI